MKTTLRLCLLALVSAMPAGTLRAIGLGPTITEIHYHPRDDEPADLEFVEIYNQDPTTFDLGGYYFSAGIEFEFPQGTFLAGRGYIVVAADSTSLKAHAQIGARILGDFTGRLDSGGEKLTLANPAGVPVVEIDYDNAGRWPHAADGTGQTLALKSVYLDPAESESWTVSAQRDGTPGRPNFPGRPPAASVILGELFTPSTGPRWLELENTGEAAVDLGGYVLSPSPLLAGAYTFAPGASIPAHAFLVVAGDALPFPLEAEPESELSIFVGSPSGGRIVDAYRFPPAANEGSSVARLPGGDNRWSSAADPTPGAPNRVTVETRIVINEIHYHPHQGSIAALGAAGGSLEFIELLNRSGEPVDLGGFAFTKGVRYAIPQGVVLAGGGYLVVAADPDTIERIHGIHGVLGPWDGVLSDRGERIVLEDPLGNTADDVHFETGGDWPQWADGGGSSLELMDASQERSAGGAWAASDESRKAPWKQFSYSGQAAGGESELHVILEHRGTVLLDDVKVTSGGVAYISNGTFEASTDGWVFEGTHVHARRTEDDAFSGIGSLEVTSSGRGDSRVNKIEADAIPALPQGASITVSYAARWVRGSNLLTTRGSNHGFAKTIDLPVPADAGTPGARNSVAVDNLGPVISRVRQSPAVPLGAETVRVDARVTDSDGVQSASLLYRKDGTSDPFSAVPMLDDGAHGDGASGDGIFSASIPAFPLNTRVSFYVEAADARGAVSVYPADAPERALLYQVSTRNITTPAHVYRIVLGADQTETLQTRKALSNDLVPGSFLFGDEEIYYNVGIRYRGSPWLRPAGQKSYRVRLEKDAPFHASRKVNLDMTGAALNERAAFYMIRQASGGLKLPYSLQAHVRLHFNGARVGLYEHVQQIDRSYVDFWFPGDDEGDLYKTDLRMDIDDGYNTTNVRNLSLDYQGTNEEQYRYNFGPRTNEEKDSFVRLIDLCRAVDPDSTAESVFRRDVEKIADVEEWVRVLAVRLLDDDWDTFGIGAKNAYFYFAPVEGRWKLIPWDSDNTFGNINATLWPNDFYRELVRVFNAPAYRRLYFRLVDSLTAGPYSVKTLSAYLNPTRVAMQAEGVADTAGIYSFITNRVPIARAILPAPAEFKVTSPNPMSVTTETATLAGTAPYTMTLLSVGGQRAEPAWIQVQNWRLVVPVHSGDNDVELLGFDEGGNVIGSAQVAIHSSAVWTPPVISAVTPREGPSAGGNDVMISGTGIREGAQAFFGAAAALDSELVAVTEPGSPPRYDVRARAPSGAGTVDVTVRNVDGNGSTLPGAYRYVPATLPFRRGSINGDERVDLSDAVALLSHLFSTFAVTCEDAADVNDDGRVDISDPIRLLNHLYLGAPAPPPPFEEPGDDPTPDALPPCRA